MYVTYHASTSGFRRTRTNRLHSRMLDLATNIRIGRLGGILDHDSFSIPVRPNGMDHSIPMVCQSGKKEWGGTYRETNGGKDGTSPTTVPEEILDRISVKDGARIHIIPIKEIFYLQACGDYVTLFTTSGQHVKEQTMKYFERSLPSPEFVRIHRSYIVNTEQILRVELFGKETYQVRLKDGTYLRASSAGYKLLKERLSL